MRILWCFVLILNASPLSALQLWLRVGEVRSVAASPEAVIRVGSRGIVRVVDGEHGVKLIGLKVGVTPVVIDEVSYMVHVEKSSSREFHQALVAEIKKMKGLKLESAVQPPEIFGTLLRFSDWKRIAEIAAESQGQYVFRARALPDVAIEALTYFQKIAKEKGFPILQFTSDPQFTAHVPTAQKGLKASVESAFSPFGIRVLASETALAIEPLVKTQVILAEINRSHSQAFGFEWPTSYQASLLPKPQAADSLSVTLKALESRGQAQILASPNLLCRSGGEAKFHAGGEFPIRIVSKTSRDVIWKQHGVMLNVKPKADFEGALSLEIETEVSLLDMANSVDGIPALKTNKVKSHFDLPGRRTIALSGLIRQQLGDSTEGLPLLSNIPILGLLFSSRQFQAHQSELVIFVTPEIHTPDIGAKIELPKGWVTHEW